MQQIRCCKFFELTPSFMEWYPIPLCLLDARKLGMKQEVEGQTMA